VNFNSEIIVGDYADGRIYAFDLDVYADDTATQKWLRSWRALPSGQNNLKRTTHHSLQLDCESGVGTAGGEYELIVTETGNVIATATGDLFTTGVENLGLDPQVMLRWSDNGGHNWSNEHWKSMGAIGETSRRVIWRRLGMTLELRDRVYELSGTAPIKLAIMGAELTLSGTNA
jgi:hypothetical protein